MSQEISISASISRYYNVEDGTFCLHPIFSYLELTVLFIPQADISRADLIDEIRRRTSEA